MVRTEIGRLNLGLFGVVSLGAVERDLLAVLNAEAANASPGANPPGTLRLTELRGVTGLFRRVPLPEVVLGPLPGAETGGSGDIPVTSLEQLSAGACRPPPRCPPSRVPLLAAGVIELGARGRIDVGIAALDPFLVLLPRYGQTCSGPLAITPARAEPPR